MIDVRDDAEVSNALFVEALCAVGAQSDQIVNARIDVLKRR